MSKISFDEWKDSMSFLIDDEFDNFFLQSIEPITNFINESYQQFTDVTKLSQFLIYEKDPFPPVTKLKAIVSLVGLSEERLKRVVSLIRFKIFGDQFNSEWDVTKITTQLISNKKFREILIDFLLNGRNSEVGPEIPLYYMKNFKLKDPVFQHNLSDFNYVERILNDNEIQGKYSNQVGAHIENIIRKKLDSYQANTNADLKYETQKEFPLFNKNIDFLIPGLSNPQILIEASYNITTGSGQSKRADQLVELSSILMRRNANFRDKIILINLCDGLGWVARQNDLRRIYEASTYVINSKNIDLIDDILDKHFQK